MALCDTLLSADFTFDCDSDRSSGLEEIALINKADIKTIAKTGNSVQITLMTGKKANKAQVYKNSAGATVAGKINDTAPSRLAFTAFFTAFERNAETAAALRAVRNGRFVMVCKSKQGTYEAYGIDAGLEFSNQEKDTNANSGMTKVTLVTPETSIGDDEYYLADNAAFIALFVPAS